MVYKFTKEMVSNLILFLDRVQYKGLKEVQAINELMNALNTPVMDSAVIDEVTASPSPTSAVDQISKD